MSLYVGFPLHTNVSLDVSFTPLCKTSNFGIPQESILYSEVVLTAELLYLAPVSLK